MKKKTIVAGLLSIATVMVLPAYADGTSDNKESNTNPSSIGDSTSVAEYLKEQQLGEVVVTTQKRHQSSIEYIIDAGNSGRQIGFSTYVGGSRSVYGLMLKVGF